jgi:2-isopropylmalate synthase
MKKTVSLYDTTLRDGAQGEGISFSDSGKLSLVRRLDAFGVRYVEGGYAGSNPRDMAFFHAVRREALRQIRVAAFGRTRKAGIRVQDDEIVRSLLDAGTPVVTLFGKSSWLHVNKVLRCTQRENAAMIADTVAYLKSKGREVFFDAEHFFDGYKASP